MGSNLLDFRTSKDAGGLEDQHECQDAEGRDVLVGDAEIGRPERLDETDQQTTQDSARQRADATQNGSREGLDAGNEAVVELTGDTVKCAENPI